MTKEEILVAKVFLEDLETKSKCNEIKILKEILEKQIEKTPTDIHKSSDMEDIECMGKDTLFGYCPVCGYKQNNFYNEYYCGDCGQRLNWN